MIGMFVMLIASTVVNNLIVAESEAVEESLAKIRVYWAARGHIDYALSRIRVTGTCNPECNAPANDGLALPTQPDDGTGILTLDNRANGLRTPLRELYNTPTARSWDYNEYGRDPTTGRPNYRLTLQHTVEEIGGVDDDGNLKLTLTLTGVGAITSLQGLPSRVRRVEYQICLAVPCDADGPPGPTNLLTTNLSGDNTTFRSFRPANP